MEGVKVVNLGDTEHNVDELRVHKLSSSAVVPARASPGAAGYDVCASEDTTIAPGTRHLVATGLQLELPHGCYGRIAPRSGLACKHSIDIGAGVIDADYRGEIKVLLINNGVSAFGVQVGDRVAQIVIERHCTPRVVLCHGALSATARGSGGFGSTGMGAARDA